MNPESFVGRNLLSILDFTPQEITDVIDLARRIKVADQTDTLWCPFGHRDILATFFLEPSSRTRLSFESAMLQCGGRVVSVADAAKTSSHAKKESYADTGQTVAAYSRIIVVRSPDDEAASEFAKGAAAFKRRVVPVINAGNGSDEHPTQALLDLMTIDEERSGFGDVRIAFIGDCLKARSIHSLALALTRYPVEMKFVSPEALAISPEFRTKLHDELGASFEECHDLKAGLAWANVIYVVRLQRERFESEEEYLAAISTWPNIDRQLLMEVNPHPTILHPLPRVDELDPDVDVMPNAAYWRQEENGLYIRMALLMLLLGKAPVA